MYFSNILCLILISFTIGFTVCSDEEYCYYPEFGPPVPKGQTVSVPGKCLQATCEENLDMYALTCAHYFPQPGCNMSEIDYSKPYPECCPHQIC